MHLRPWQVEHTRTLFSHPRVVLTEKAVRLPDRSLVEDYLQIRMAEHVIIIARSQDDKLLVQWQSKHGRQTIGLTFAARTIGPGEEPSRQLAGNCSKDKAVGRS